MKPWPLVPGHKQLAARLVHEQLDRVGRLLDVDHQAERLAVALPAGSLSAPSV